MALTQAQIDEARAWLNNQYGGSRDASGTYRPGQFQFNPQDADMGRGILGAAQAMGYGSGDIASILGPGYDAGMVDSYASGVDPNIVNMRADLFRRDAGAGMFDTSQGGPTSNGLPSASFDSSAGPIPAGNPNMGPFPSNGPGGVTNDQINGWLQANPGATDQQIRSAMNQYGVGVDQMARATGMDYNTVYGRYQAAGQTPTAPTGQGNTQASPGQFGGGAGSTYQSNPWMTSVADDMQRRTMQGLGEGFNMIRSNSAGVGGLGGSRQGVAEGVMGRGAFDSLQGNLAGLFGSDWTNSQNRNLTRYGMDQNYSLGLGGLDNQRYGMDQNFYTQQRGQDQSQLALGANLYNLGQQGGWGGLNNAGSIYGGVAGNNTTLNVNGQRGGAQGLLGGAITGASLGKQFGWWGN